MPAASVMLSVLVSSWIVASGAQLPLDVDPRAGFRIAAPQGLEKQVLDDGADGRFDRVELLRAALVASGVPEGRIDEERDAVRAALAPAIALAKKGKDEHERGDRLLRALHRQPFVRYVEDQSAVDEVVHGGEFNCLSSALLFVVAADGLVHAPRAMLTKYHAFARVNADGADVDVETTSPEGFAADRSKLLTPSRLRSLGASAQVSDRELLADLARPEELPVVALVGALYSNRAVALIRRGDVEGAAVALDRAARLSGGDGPFAQRVADWRASLLNNAIGGLVNAGRLDDARALALLALQGSRGQTRDVVEQNLANVCVRLAERAIARGAWADARASLQEALAHGTPRRTIDSALASVNGRLAAADADGARCTALDDVRARAHCHAERARVLRQRGDREGELSAARDAVATGVTDDDVASAIFAPLATRINEAVQQSRCVEAESLVREASLHARRVALSTPWRPDEIVGGCWWHAGDRAYRAGSVDDAVMQWTRARAFLPHEDGLVRNLATVQLKRALPDVQRGACDEARPVVHRAVVDAETRAQARALLAACQNQRALQAQARGDPAAAIEELRRGLLDDPGNDALTQNLVALVHNAAVRALQAGDCDGAIEMALELSRRGDSETAREIRRRCRAQR